jgi:hypothetical protein
VGADTHGRMQTPTHTHTHTGFPILLILTGQMTISAGIFDQISSNLHPNT